MEGKAERGRGVGKGREVRGSRRAKRGRDFCQNWVGLGEWVSNRGGEGREGGREAYLPSFVRVCARVEHLGMQERTSIQYRDLHIPPTTTHQHIHIHPQAPVNKNTTKEDRRKETYGPPIPPNPPLNREPSSLIKAFDILDEEPAFELAGAGAHGHPGVLFWFYYACLWTT